MEDQGHIIPELQNQPELFSDSVPYLSAFRCLSTSRQMGFGIGYIPYSEICSYLNENQIESYYREDYIQWIQLIDSIYVELQSKKKT
jgi:hypothetical protein